MGRPRGFDTDEVLQRARDAFVSGGYAGTSVDALLRATGIQRASLYQAFGSKRGLFAAVLSRSASSPDASMAPPDIDVLLVALMDLCSTDEEIRQTVRGQIDRLADRGAAELLGARLLRRAGLLDPVAEPEPIANPKDQLKQRQVKENAHEHRDD